jgi:hypothetical protein
MFSCWKTRKGSCKKNKKRGIIMKKKDKKNKSLKNKKTIPEDIPIIWVNI